MKRVTAIIQARMGSTRLPGKVLMPIMGRPLLDYLMERIKRCSSVDDIIIATTRLAEDDAIAQYCEEREIHCYRGSSENVLERYHDAARTFEAKHIMRLTGDCPLCEPAICDKVAEEFFQHEADYVFTGSSFAEGLDCEVFSFHALKIASEQALLSSEKEHATLFFRNHPELFQTLALENETDDSLYRVTVDESEDFAVVEAVIEALVPTLGLGFTFDDVRNFLEKAPAIRSMNTHIVRNEGLMKSLADEEESR